MNLHIGIICMIPAIAIVTLYLYEKWRANDQAALETAWRKNTDLQAQVVSLKQEVKALRAHSLAVLEENEQLSQVLSLYIGKALHDVLGAPMHQNVEDEQPALPFDMPFNVEDRRGN